MYLDANFFIFANFASDRRGQKARAILKNVTNGKLAITSSLALDEVMWVLIKNRQDSELRAIIEEIYSIKNLEVKEVPAIIPLRALEFIEVYKLKPRDAFHIAIMEHFGVKEIVSDDSDFDKVKEIKRIKI